MVFSRHSVARELALGLIRRSLDAARVFGFHRVELTVRENNTSAVELYNKIGFEVEGLQCHVFKSTACTKTCC